MTHYSPSQASMWLRCHAQWAWRYKRGIISPPGAALIIGKSAHVAAEGWHRRGLQLGDGWSPEAAIAAFGEEEARALAADAFTGSSPDVDWSREDESNGQAGDRAVRMAGAYVRQIGPRAGRPIVVEHRAEVSPVGRDWTLVTVADVIVQPDASVSGARAIRDLKTSAKAPPGASQDAIQVSPVHRRQLAAYRYSWRAEHGTSPLATVIDFVWSTSSAAKSAVAPVLVDDHDEALLFAVLDSMHKADQAGLYPRNPDSWACSPRWCAYHDRCCVQLQEP